MITTKVNYITPTLYEKDFYLWLETTAKLLRDRQLNQLDYENLIEEIEAMGRSEKHALESNLIVVLMHLLKYQYQPEKRSKSWLSSIFEHRRRLVKTLQSSPSLKVYYQEVFNECYEYAVKQASIETGLLLENFPNISLFTQEETLDFDFLPK
ncbi:DUF29 domain-containing protein [Crocosphaera sp. XPORK-15E]|uniref:DUF29 domain-containing protein n=1 Tax=Crocosphaera sp. XPORK-15E TaxID=3110247 RepID=UPI002B1F8A63|nr:DUF29 domain-containing protein [Crocosphaera sp. XPORK-15E]MEA5534416.1 DUF29 domain-containing protein [Crocosphaera sp. XPORK-15E]